LYDKHLNRLDDYVQGNRVAMVCAFYSCYDGYVCLFTDKSEKRKRRKRQEKREVSEARQNQRRRERTVIGERGKHTTSTARMNACGGRRGG
jgi:hypothetical protein